MATTTTPQAIAWSAKYSVGIAQVDAEHQKLVGLVNDLNAAMMEGRAKTVLDRIFDQLIAYTTSHFAHEEGLMRLYSYPEFAQHKADHDKLVKKAKELQAEFHSGNVTISLEVMSFLRDWLVGHICGVDKRYTAHLQAAGLK